MGLSKIWIYGEAREGVVATTTLELLAKARSLADTVDVVVQGDASPLAADLGAHGASSVLSVGEETKRQKMRERTQNEEARDRKSVV